VVGRFGRNHDLLLAKDNVGVGPQPNLKLVLDILIWDGDANGYSMRTGCLGTNCQKSYGLGWLQGRGHFRWRDIQIAAEKFESHDWTCLDFFIAYG
jgi:hypothetical protein